MSRLVARFGRPKSVWPGLLDRTLERFALWPATLAADSAYGSAENLAWLVHEPGIEPHIPVFD